MELPFDYLRAHVRPELGSRILETYPPTPEHGKDPVAPPIASLLRKVPSPGACHNWHPAKYSVPGQSCADCGLNAEL